MSYIELKANVKQNIKSIQFCPVEWLDVNSFKAKLLKNNPIEPFIEHTNGTRIYVGKTIPSFYNYRIEVPYKTELIGMVYENLSNKKWTLVVSWDSRTYEFNENFLVLNLNDEKYYEWKLSSLGDVPKYALRGAVENNISEFLYIGKTVDNYKFGKIHVSLKVLYVASFDNKELSHEEYQVLCLKPSPTSLKNLCRLKLRSIIQTNEKFLTLSNRLPSSLVEYLLYPQALCRFDFIQNDRLISKCGCYALFINRFDKIVCMNVHKRKNLNFFDLFRNFESICLTQNHILFVHKNSYSFSIFSKVITNKSIPYGSDYKWQFEVKDIYNSANEEPLKYIEIIEHVKKCIVKTTIINDQLSMTMNYILVPSDHSSDDDNNNNDNQ